MRTTRPTIAIRTKSGVLSRFCSSGRPWPPGRITSFFETNSLLNFSDRAGMSFSSASSACRYSTAMPASACGIVTPGARRAMTSSHIARRLPRPFQVGVICAFIASGTNSSSARPICAPWNPGAAIPITVSGWPLTPIERPEDPGSPPKRRRQ